MFALKAKNVIRRKARKSSKLRSQLFLSAQNLRVIEPRLTISGIFFTLLQQYILNDQICNEIIKSGIAFIRIGPIKRPFIVCEKELTKGKKNLFNEF